MVCARKSIMEFLHSVIKYGGLWVLLVFNCTVHANAQNVDVTLCKNDTYTATSGSLYTGGYPGYVDGTMCMCSIAANGDRADINMNINLHNENSIEDGCSPVLSIGGADHPTPFHVCPKDNSMKYVTIVLHQGQTVNVGIENPDIFMYRVALSFTVSTSGSVNITCYESHEGALMGGDKFMAAYGEAVWHDDEGSKGAIPRHKTDMSAVAGASIAGALICIVIFGTILAAWVKFRCLKKDQPASEEASTSKTAAKPEGSDNPAYAGTPAASIYSHTTTEPTGSTTNVSFQPYPSTASLHSRSSAASSVAVPDAGLGLILKAGARPRDLPLNGDGCFRPGVQPVAVGFMNDAYDKGPGMQLRKERSPALGYVPCSPEDSANLKQIPNISGSVRGTQPQRPAPQFRSAAPGGPPETQPNQTVERPLIHRAASPFREDLKAASPTFDPRSPISENSPPQWPSPRSNKPQPQSNASGSLQKPMNQDSTRPKAAPVPSMENQSRAMRPQSLGTKVNYPSPGHTPVQVPARGSNMAPIFTMDDEDISYLESGDETIGPFAITPKKSGVIPPSPGRPISRSSGDYGPERYTLQIAKPSGETEL